LIKWESIKKEKRSGRKGGVKRDLAGKKAVVKGDYKDRELLREESKTENWRSARQQEVGEGIRRNLNTVKKPLKKKKKKQNTTTNKQNQKNPKTNNTPHKHPPKNQKKTTPKKKQNERKDFPLVTNVIAVHLG